MASMKHMLKMAQLVPSELRGGIWPYKWSLLEAGMAAGEDDDDNKAVVERVAGPITYKKP
jgi:hypothetical protein